MNASETSTSELRHIFQRRRARRRTAVCVSLAALIALPWVATGTVNRIAGIPDTVLLVILIAIIAAAFAFGAFDWRCPRCGEYLGNGLNPANCERCGFELRAQEVTGLTL